MIAVGPVLVLLALLGAPLFAVIAASAMFGFSKEGIDLQAIAIEFYSIAEMPILLAIPLFILLSAPIAESDASKDLYETLHKWLYKIPGGLGIANMIGCGIFAALCGSSPATAAAIGGIGIPEMRKRGYSPALSTGLIAHAGTFGILIPPSVTMILYGVATETSIGKCFIADLPP